MQYQLYHQYPFRLQTQQLGNSQAHEMTCLTQKSFVLSPVQTLMSSFLTCQQIIPQSISTTYYKLYNRD
jgi:hypothetical protein